jgi:hypothetical protein
MNYFKDSDIELTVSSNQQLKKITLINNLRPVTYFDSLKLKQNTLESIPFINWLKLNS